MIKQAKHNIAGEIDKLNDSETQAVATYISQILSKRLSKNAENSANNDDVIISLSDTYENKRARQVFEWEKARRQNVQRAA